MYMFTNLHVSVHKYGSQRKFRAKNEQLTKVVNSTMWYFYELVQN